MGNQLVSVVPSEILPVEHYLTDNHGLYFDIRQVYFVKYNASHYEICFNSLSGYSLMFLIPFYSLGSTRFFKVARAKSQEGLVVVKVFAIQDPTLPLGVHRERLDYIRTHLASAFNCLPFQKVVVCYYNTDNGVCFSYHNLSSYFIGLLGELLFCFQFE